METYTVQQWSKTVRYGGDISWPTRSPDLTVTYLSAWYYLKECVLFNKIRNRDKLNENITNEINQLTPELLTRSLDGVVTVARPCGNSDGGHLKDIIFHNWNDMRVKFVRNKLSTVIKN
jgi:hypothetical protein